MRRAPLALRIALEGLGRTPAHALRFEAGEAVGVFRIVEKTGPWCGAARWKLRCPNGHFFERTASDIRRAQKGERPLRCTECPRGKP